MAAFSYGVTTVVGSLLFGRAADACGRRRTMALALAAAAAALALAAAAGGASRGADWAPALAVLTAGVFGVGDSGVNTLTCAPRRGTSGMHF